MNEAASLSAIDAVSLLSRATARPYRLVGPLAGGETGAHEVRGPDGERLVAKWEIDPSSQDARCSGVWLTERLREVAGWPVPRQQIVETDTCLFVLQEFLPGLPVEMLTHVVLAEILELHQNRIGLERPSDNSVWPDPLIQTLTVGGNGYCLHEPLRNCDIRTAKLLERVEEIGHEGDPNDLAGGDVVHWDLHPGNLLQDDGQLSAVIDTDFAMTGDAAFDLVTLALTSLTIACEPGVRKRLFDFAVEPLEEACRRAYVGHLLLRFLDWSIRHGRTKEIEFWLSQTDRLLAS